MQPLAHRKRSSRSLGRSLGAPVTVHSWHPMLFPLAAGVMGLAIAALMIAASLVHIIVNNPIGLATFFPIMATLGVIFLLYRGLRWVYHLLGARYLLTPDTLILRTEDWHQNIPLRRIYRVVTGDNIPDSLVDTLTLGYRRGYARVPGVGEAWFLATSRSREHLIMLTTEMGNYVLSPSDPGTLMREMASRGVPFAPGRLPRSALAGHRVRLPFAHDQRAWALLAIGIITNLLMVAFVAVRIPDLPPFLPLHYNAIGEVDFIGTPSEAFRLPGIAGGLLVGNVALATIVHRYERLAAYMFLGAAALVQMVMLVATANLLR